MTEQRESREPHFDQERFPLPQSFSNQHFLTWFDSLEQPSKKVVFSEVQRAEFTRLGLSPYPVMTPGEIESRIPFPLRAIGRVLATASHWFGMDR
jgi:hypothetical protein